MVKGFTNTKMAQYIEVLLKMAKNKGKEGTNLSMEMFMKVILYK